MILNAQKRVHVDLPRVREYAKRLRAALKLGRKVFGVCFVDDATIAALNARFRSKSRPTDVLSFPWAPEHGAGKRRPGSREPREFNHFLGDVVISAETARRNARAAGHSTAREIRWLILHGALHLLGYDHETDHGAMTKLELALRDQLQA